MMRHSQSKQKSTFGNGSRTWNDLPQNTPGPNAYSELVPKPREFCAFKNDGYSIPKSASKSVLHTKPDEPGPGNYYPAPLSRGYSKPMLGGKDEKIDEPEKDNGVPGPGMYNAKHSQSVPSFVIVKPGLRSKTATQNPKDPVGPWKYKPQYPGDTFKGQKYPGQQEGDELNEFKKGTFGNARRDGNGAVIEDENTRKHKNNREKTAQYLGVPGPGAYRLTGDFDFRDPTRPEDRVGKQPKFAFGVKHSQKPRNLDQPGPGEYEVDTYPMNQANIAYWIGTDVRRDLAVPSSHMYPGPGQYEAEDMNKAPAVSFPRELKQTVVEKTNDPGPTTYAQFDTVGVLPGYAKQEVHPRVATIQPKR